MTIRDKYQIVESLVPLLDDKDWKTIVYHIDSRYTSRINNVIVAYLACKDKTLLERSWLCGDVVMRECLSGGCCDDFRMRELYDEEASAILRGAEAVD